MLGRLLRGRDGQAELPYQVEMGLSQIMLAVLSHTRDEVSTFWIVTSLIDNYELRQFYQRGLPGITVYGEVLDALVSMKLPRLAAALRKHGVSYTDFFEPWASSLLTSEVPVDLTIKVVASFLKDGWAYFFRLCLTILQCLERSILSLDEDSSVTGKRQRILAILHFRSKPPPRCGDDENFAVDDDDRKEFDNNFALIDDRSRRVSECVLDKKRRELERAE